MRLLRQRGRQKLKIRGQKYLLVPKGGELQAEGARENWGRRRENRGDSAHPAADPRPRSPKRGLTTVPRAQAAPAGLTPEQSERLGFGDEHQGVHGRQVEQAHQDDVPPDDVLPLPACARPLRAAAVRRALDPRTDPLCGVAEGDFAPGRGPAWHGWGEVGAGGSDSRQAELCWRGALRWGRGLLPFRGESRHLSSRLPGAPLVPSLFRGRSAWPKDAHLGARHLLLACRPCRCRAELGCKEEGASATGGRGAEELGERVWKQSP